MTIAVGASEQKRAAALEALRFIPDGAVVGLGSGSTARYLVAELAARLASGELGAIRAVPTSRATEQQARELGIPLIELPAAGVDVAIDGMDEVDPQLRAIKGLGGALAREKIVAAGARRFVLIGDESKVVETLAERTPLPVEVLSFGWQRTARLLEELGLEPRLRRTEGALFRTDNGNPVLDCKVLQAVEPERLAAGIDALPGVVEHGLFLGLVERALIAGPGGVRELGPLA